MPLIELAKFTSHVFSMRFCWVFQFHSIAETSIGFAFAIPKLGMKFPKFGILPKSSSAQDMGHEHHNTAELADQTWRVSCAFSRKDQDAALFETLGIEVHDWTCIPSQKVWFHFIDVHWCLLISNGFAIVSLGLATVLHEFAIVLHVCAIALHGFAIVLLFLHRFARIRNSFAVICNSVA